LTTIYEFFGTYGLTPKKPVFQTLMGWSDTRLTLFVEAYIELATMRELAFRVSPGATDIYPDSWDETLPFEIVKQLAIYANRIYLHDTLLHTARRWQSFDFEIPLIMQYSSHEKKRRYYRQLLSSDIERMMALRPLVEAEIVHFTPTALIQPYRDAKDIYADSLYGANSADVPALQQLPPPEAVMEYCRDHLRVVPVHFGDQYTPILHEQETLSPRRAIAVYFVGDPSPFIYQLGDINVDNSEDGVVNIWYPYDERTPVDEGMFWNWVEGSKRQRIIARLERLQQDLMLAAEIKAQFLTTLPTSKDLAVVDMTPASKQRAAMTTALMRMNLPYFDQATFSSIARARRNEEAFEGFRDALDTALKEVTSISDPDDIQRRIDEVANDILARPIAKIDQQMKRFHRKLIPGSIVLIGSLAATIITNGNTLATLPAIGASASYAIPEIIKAFQDRQEQREQIKEFPSFFYWDVTHNKRVRRSSNSQKGGMFHVGTLPYSLKTTKQDA
jgi:hypothetical protein